MGISNSFKESAIKPVVCLAAESAPVFDFPEDGTLQSEACDLPLALAEVQTMRLDEVQLNSNQNNNTCPGDDPSATILRPQRAKKRQQPEHEDTPRPKRSKRQHLEEEFQRLKTRLGSDECLICKASWELDGIHRATILKCGHIFGRNCVERWLVLNKVCPYCRARTTMKDKKYVFCNFKVPK